MQFSLKAISCNFQRKATESLKVKVESLKQKMVGENTDQREMLKGKSRKLKAKRKFNLNNGSPHWQNSPVIILTGNTNQRSL